jgi:hypothetical protein
MCDSAGTPGKRPAGTLENRRAAPNYQETPELSSRDRLERECQADAAGDEVVVRIVRNDI